MTRSHINELDTPFTKLLELQNHFINKVGKNKIPKVKPSMRNVLDIYSCYDYPIYLIYDYLWEKVQSQNYPWIRCSCCNKWFEQKRKNTTACCPAHSSVMRKRKCISKK